MKNKLFSGLQENAETIHNCIRLILLEWVEYQDLYIFT